MLFRNIIIITLLAFLSPVFIIAQGKLIYLNGKEKRFTTAEVRGEYIVYQPEGSTKEWSRKADKYNVFSILRDDGTEEIIYTPDTSDGGDPTVAEVRDYIHGEQHAKIVFNKPENMFIGFEIGLISSFAGFYGIPAPVIYSTIIGNVNPKIPRNERDQIHSAAFLAGYQHKARNMKIKQSLLGGAIGFGVGLTALVLIFK